jgi:hypothetical protein
MATWPTSTGSQYTQDVINLIRRDPIGALAVGRASDKIKDFCWEQLEPLHLRLCEASSEERDQIKKDIETEMLRLWALKWCC